MFNDILLTDNISFILVFLGGIFSFFSPCIIPLLPVYMSYLSGNTATTDDQGNISYNQKKVFTHTRLLYTSIISINYIKKFLQYIRNIKNIKNKFKIAR